MTQGLMPRGFTAVLPTPNPSITRPSAMVKGRTILETKYTLPFTNPDLILHFRRTKGAGIIERSPWAVLRKKDKRSYVEGRDTYI